MKELHVDFSKIQELDPIVVQQAHARIEPYIRRTPLLASSLLNSWLGHRIIFKAENMQKIGSFKVRGALNHILYLKEQGNLPQEVVCFSSGNHAQAVALSCALVGVKATIFMQEATSTLKRQAAIDYGANVIVTATRQIAEQETLDYAAKNNAVIIPPYDDDLVIAGQGTAAFEALHDCDQKPDAIFATCGGGGWLSGSYLAKALLSPSSKIFGIEPEIANDAKRSYDEGKLYRFDQSPTSVADGVRTLSLSARTFFYAQKTDGFVTASEQEIAFWFQWISHLLKLHIEPTSALAMAGAFDWLKLQSAPQTILVLLSGGNVEAQTSAALWGQSNYLECVPHIDLDINSL